MRKPKVQALEITREDLLAWEARVAAVIEDVPEDLAILHALVASYWFVREALSKARVSVNRLKRLFFGPQSEKKGKIFPKPSEDGKTQGGRCGSGSTGNESKDKSSDEGQQEKGEKSSKSKGKGHGRNGADQYVGAQRIEVPHPTLQSGDPCPNDGCDGKVYPMKKPKKILRVVGQPALMAILLLLERLRCNLCEEIFTAPPPVEVAEDKYDETAVAMIALLHFANGFAFHRLEQHQAQMGIPLPASVQSELLSKAYSKLRPVFDALIWHAAQCEILHNDDTGMKILTLLAQIKEAKERESGSKSKKKKRRKKERTGIYTTGIVAVSPAYLISLYFTGRKHAGENLESVLQKREPGLPPPIHVSDGLGHNRPGKIVVHEGKCLAHGRRQFVDIVVSFPDECREVVDLLAEVYRVDAIAREKELSDEDRLFLHLEKSEPVMRKLRRWLEDQFLVRDDVEPNSPLGRAVKYLLDRWEPLTLFLRQPGVPLDNSIAERILKKAIRHRRNSLFYKTEQGALVGDLFMSLIETCTLNEVNPFDYLTSLLRNVDRIQESPKDWMPWNYQALIQASPVDASCGPEATQQVEVDGDVEKEKASASKESASPASREGTSSTTRSPEGPRPANSGQEIDTPRGSITAAAGAIPRDRRYPQRSDSAGNPKKVWDIFRTPGRETTRCLEPHGHGSVRRDVPGEARPP